MEHGDDQKANEGSDAYTMHELKVRSSHYSINLSVFAIGRVKTISGRYYALQQQAKY